MYQANLKNQKTKHFPMNVSSSRISISITPIPSIDRISSLPTEIVHHIMTLLPTKFATRTSVLSKRFNSLWWSFPRIDFNENHHFNRYRGDGPYTRNKFMDQMRQCYKRHDLKFLEKLKILAVEPINAWEENNLSTMIDSFVFAAIEGEALKEMDLRFPLTDEPHLQDLTDIDMFQGSFYMMPKIPLFTWCNSLESLKLEGCSFAEFGTMVQNINLPSVRELYIRNCLISDNVLTKLIQGCPELEDLSFKFCVDVKVVSFSHSKLNKLVIGCYSSPVVLKIDVPNLQTFKFRGAYWQFTLADPTSELRLGEEHIINSPDLETFCVKYACVDRISMQMSLTTKFKNLKNLVLNHCYLERVSKLMGDKLESVVISSSEFGEEGFLLTGANLPILRSLTIHSCKGLAWLSINSETLEELNLKECIGLEEWVIYAPKVSCLDCIDMGKP